MPIGVPVTLTYDVRADFTSASQVGFNAIRLVTPEAVDFQRFEMGDPLAVVEPDSIMVTDQSLEVYFPSNPVERSSNVPLRLTFGTRVFNFITLFEGEVFQIAGENLSQSIDGGDATLLVSTNDLRVITPLDRLEVLSELNLGTALVTPNGDGIHDRLELAYTLHGVSAADVEVGVYDLAGNVMEWVSDYYSRTYYRDSPVADPQGPQAGRFKIARGGAWNGADIDTRCADRGGAGTNQRGGYILGFRCARSVGD